MQYYEGRVVLLKAQVGSVNYNLKTKESDQDNKIYVAPTFDDLMNQIKFTHSTTSPTEDNAIHDIRDFKKHLLKSNVNFIEILFSQDLRLFDDRLKALVEMREDIARMNLAYLYFACKGMYYNKVKYIESGTKSTRYLVEKYGYDTKSYMSSYRILDVLKRYQENGFTDFKKVICYGDEERVKMLELREGRDSLEEAKKVLQEKLEEYNSLAEIYTAKECNKETEEKINNIIRTIVYDTIQKQEK